MEDVPLNRRVLVATVAFLLAACSAQATAPRPSAAPSASATATPRPTNAANDVIYLRSVGPAGVANIYAISARTGETMRAMPNGPISFDRQMLYAPELQNGATQTLVHVIDVSTGRELRAFTIDGAYDPTPGDAGQQGLSRDGRHLALFYPPGKLDNEWVTRMAVVDTASGTIEAKLELRSQSTFGFAALSPDGRSLYLNQYGEGVTKTRIFDVPSSTLLPAAVNAGAGAMQSGFRTPAVLSPDGRWMYSFDAGNPTTNCTSTDGPSCVPNATPPYLVAVDMLSRRIATVTLPADQSSSDFEKYLLWSVGAAPSGDSVYAINPALGIVDEIDARQLTLRRTGKINVSRGDDGALAAFARFLFPVAEAKRYIAGGAVFSPDGSRIYAAASHGVAVIDTATLTTSASWPENRDFDALALTADGERLYAVSNATGVVAIVSTRDGASLGQLKIPAYGQSIVRIDSAR